MQSLKEEILNYKETPKSRKRLVYFTKVTTYKTKCSTSKSFLNSNLYKKIKEATAFLPKDIESFFRLKAIFKDIHKMEKCPFCEKNKAISKDIGNGDFFNKTCGSLSCITKIAAHKAIENRKTIYYKEKLSQIKTAYIKKNAVKIVLNY